MPVILADRRQTSLCFEIDSKEFIQEFLAEIIQHDSAISIENERMHNGGITPTLRNFSHSPVELKSINDSYCRSSVYVRLDYKWILLDN